MGKSLGARFYGPLCIRYDTIEEFNVNVTRKLSIQLYLAHVARKRN